MLLAPGLCALLFAWPSAQVEHAYQLLPPQVQQGIACDVREVVAMPEGSPENVLGETKYRTIALNLSELDTPAEIAATMAHEYRHIQQKAYWAWLLRGQWPQDINLFRGPLMELDAYLYAINVSLESGNRAMSEYACWLYNNFANGLNERGLLTLLWEIRLKSGSVVWPSLTEVY